MIIISDFPIRVTAFVGFFLLPLAFIKLSNQAYSWILYCVYLYFFVCQSGNHFPNKKSSLIFAASIIFSFLIMLLASYYRFSKFSFIWYMTVLAGLMSLLKVINNHNHQSFALSSLIAMLLNLNITFTDYIHITLAIIYIASVYEYILPKFIYFQKKHMQSYTKLSIYQTSVKMNYKYELYDLSDFISHTFSQELTKNLKKYLNNPDIIKHATFLVEQIENTINLRQKILNYHQLPMDRIAHSPIFSLLIKFAVATPRRALQTPKLFNDWQLYSKKLILRSLEQISQDEVTQNIYCELITYHICMLKSAEHLRAYLYDEISS